MNELDKSLYRALKFLADHTRAEIRHWKEMGNKDYEKSVPSTSENPTEQTLKQYDYIDLNGTTKWMITQNGLRQLRDLEQIKHRDLTVWLSGFALVISILSFAISQEWIRI